MNELSDTNLRSHLSRVHDMKQFFYPSQYRKKPPKVIEQISNQRKKESDEAAIQAIVEDSHSFNLFRKSGMRKFLELAVPGYRGPHHLTVVKRLASTYKKHRSTTRLNLSSITDISLSADLWKSARRDHFMCLSAHYYDDSFHFQSSVIAFRRFLGTHYSRRIYDFITNEIEKFDIQTKIRALTTDNGSDIRSATQNKSEFGIRISCGLHNLNLITQNGLWLFRMPKKKR